MVKNHKLAKPISDCGWGTFVRQLQYKAEWNDKQIIKINRWFPSSKSCCECGWINQDLNLSVREWTCINGHKLDRDLNAAKNILKEGLRIISSGTERLHGWRLKSDFSNEAQVDETRSPSHRRWRGWVVHQRSNGSYRGIDLLMPYEPRNILFGK